MINIALLTSDLELDLTENIVQYFNDYPDAQISCIISNKKDSVIKNRLRRYKKKIFETDLYKNIDKILTETNSHYVVLSGYSDKIPPNFCKKYDWKIIDLKKNNRDISIFFVKENFNVKDVIFKKDLVIINKKEELSDDEIKSQVNDMAFNFYPVLIEKIIRETFKKIYTQE